MVIELQPYVNLHKCTLNSDKSFWENYIYMKLKEPLKIQIFFASPVHFQHDLTFMFYPILIML
jgi:hypothetical protein